VEYWNYPNIFFGKNYCVSIVYINTMSSRYSDLLESLVNLVRGSGAKKGLAKSIAAKINAATGGDARANQSVLTELDRIITETKYDTVFKDAKGLLQSVSTPGGAAKSFNEQIR
jgi:hypothetical protein